MLKNILIIGGKGNMGRRYAACLRALQVKYEVFDIPGEPISDYGDYSRWDGFIIATPTAIHAEQIDEILHATDAPILCEKPICTDLRRLQMLLDCTRANSINLRMVNQYEYCLRGALPSAKRDTIYDFYHSGTDGLYWDCINIIGMDETDNITLKNESPLWTCRINGKRLSKDAMDHAYLEMIANWVRSPTPNLEYIEKAHRKVIALMEKDGQLPKL